MKQEADPLSIKTPTGEPGPNFLKALSNPACSRCIASVASFIFSVCWSTVDQRPYLGYVRPHVMNAWSP